MKSQTSNSFVTCLWVALLFLGLIEGIQAQQQKHLYVTHSITEPDRCASAWLIKRFVNTDAHFGFIAAGELVEKGIAFDTPDAKWRRTHNASAFESILAHHKLEDPKLDQIAQYIHDIEINFWAEKRFTESKKLDFAITKLTLGLDTNEQLLNACLDYFDNYYEHLSDEQ